MKIRPQIYTREWRKPEMEYVWENMKDFCISGGFLIFKKGN